MICARIRTTVDGEVLVVDPQWYLTEEEEPVALLFRKGATQVTVQFKKFSYVYYKTRSTRWHES